jgi:hypothetical protein
MMSRREAHARGRVYVITRLEMPVLCFGVLHGGTDEPWRLRRPRSDWQSGGKPPSPLTRPEHRDFNLSRGQHMSIGYEQRMLDFFELHRWGAP